MAAEEHAFSITGNSCRRCGYRRWSGQRFSKRRPANSFTSCETKSCAEPARPGRRTRWFSERRVGLTGLAALQPEPGDRLQLVFPRRLDESLVAKRSERVSA